MNNKKSVKGIMLDGKDNVAIVTADTMPGDPVFYCRDENHYIVSRDEIRQYHKIALSDIEKGSFVIRYGEKIGVAIKNIKAGESVHVHNLKSESEARYEGIV